jgi:hypothetical protein
MPLAIQDGFSLQKTIPNQMRGFQPFPGLFLAFPEEATVIPRLSRKHGPLRIYTGVIPLVT